MLAAVTGHLGRDRVGDADPAARAATSGERSRSASGPTRLPGVRRRSTTRPGPRSSRRPGRESRRSRRGLDAEAMVAGCRGLVVVAEELTAALPGGRSAASMARRAPRFVVVLDAFATATARRPRRAADRRPSRENDGTTTSFDGRVQRVRAVRRSPGQARHGWAGARGARHAGSGCRCDLSGRPTTSSREMADLVPRFAEIGEDELDESWGALVSSARGGARGPLPDGRPRAPATRRAPLRGGLRRGVRLGQRSRRSAHAPTLCRDHVAQRKLFPAASWR